MQESVLSILMLSVPYISLHFHQRITDLMHVPWQVLNLCYGCPLHMLPATVVMQPCFWFLSIDSHNMCWNQAAQTVPDTVLYHLHTSKPCTALNYEFGSPVSSCPSGSTAPHQGEELINLCLDSCRTPHIVKHQFKATLLPIHLKILVHQVCSEAKLAPKTWSSEAHQAYDKYRASSAQHLLNTTVM